MSYFLATSISSCYYFSIKKSRLYYRLYYYYIYFYFFSFSQHECLNLTSISCIIVYINIKDRKSNLYIFRFYYFLLLITVFIKNTDYRFSLISSDFFVLKIYECTRLIIFLYELKTTKMERNNNETRTTFFLLFYPLKYLLQIN